MRYGLKFTGSAISVGVWKIHLVVNIFLKNCFIFYELKNAATKAGIQLWNKLFENTEEKEPLLGSFSAVLR